jgi:acid phosphatase type 7
MLAMALRGIARVCVCACLLAGAAHAKPKMVKGPYLQDLGPTSITVMWQLEPVAPARLIVTGPGGEQAQDIAPGRIVEARIEDLQPSTRYRYRVETADQTWSGEFATAPPGGKDVPFSFIVVGDSRNGVEQHRRVVERMAQEVPDFVLGTGDMVDEGYRLDQWQQFFDIQGPLLRDNAFFPALGNHDRQGRGRTADTYRAFFSVPENGGDSERYYAFTYGATRVLVLDSNAYSFALTDQTAWLERELIAVRQDPGMRHIFVVMHHPPFSISLHGGATDLRERWTPLFEKYQVTAVFSGHDHVYSRAEHNGIRYFVTGGAGAPLYPRRAKPNPSDAAAVKKFERVFHYLRVTVTGTRIEVTAVRADGTTIETAAWHDDPPLPEVVRPAQLASTGAPRTAPPVVAPASAPPAQAPGSERTLWIGLVGLVVALGAAVAAVRTLRV